MSRAGPLTSKRAIAWTPDVPEFPLSWRNWPTGSERDENAMRYLILTDIHANLEGFETCLQDAKVRGYDEVLVLGDIVGYGPDPNAVIDRVRALNPLAIVRGNHDKVALGLS